LSNVSYNQKSVIIPPEHEKPHLGDERLGCFQKPPKDEGGVDDDLEVEALREQRAENLR
jgi:hypothetical protein